MTLIGSLCCLHQIPHHDMEIHVFAVLFSWKEGQVLSLQLADVVKYSSRVETSLSNGHVVFDSWWKGKKTTKCPKMEISVIVFMLKYF